MRRVCTMWVSRMSHVYVQYALGWNVAAAHQALSHRTQSLDDGSMGPPKLWPVWQCLLIWFSKAVTATLEQAMCGGLVDSCKLLTCVRCWLQC